MILFFGGLQDNGLNVHLLCNEAECGSSLLEAVDVHQDWRTFLQSLFGDFSGDSHLPCKSKHCNT